MRHRCVHVNAANGTFMNTDCVCLCVCARGCVRACEMECACQRVRVMICVCLCLTNGSVEVLEYSGSVVQRHVVLALEIETDYFHCKVSKVLLPLE